MKKLSLFFVFLLPLLSFAQQVFVKGYIIDQKGDTTHGWIRDQSDKQLTKQIFFKADLSQTNSQTIEPKSVKQFEFEYGRHFVSFDLGKALANNSGDTATVFMKKIVDGDVELYKLALGTNAETFFVYSDSSGLVTLEPPVKSNKTNAGNEDTYLTRYVGVLNTIFNKCNENKNIWSDSKYNRENLSNAFVNYNQCIGSANPIVYKDKASVRPILTAGYMYVPATQKYNEYNGMRLAFFVDINYPERYGLSFSFKPGITWQWTNQKSSSNKKKHLFSLFPAVASLTYNTNTFKPYFDFGLGFGAIPRQSQINSIILDTYVLPYLAAGVKIGKKGGVVFEISSTPGINFSLGFIF